MLRRWFVTTPLAALIFIGFWLRSRFGAPQSHHGVGSRWSRRLLRAAGVDITVSGTAPGAGGPFVVVCNHQSLLDTPILLAYAGLELRFIAKQSLFQAPIIGGHLQRGGHIAVVREDARGAMESLAAAEKVVRERGLSVLVFAEGTRSTEGLGEFKTGAAHLAIQTGVPVLPIALTGSAGLLPKGSFTIHSGQVRVAIGEPIRTTGLTRRDREALTATVRQSVARLLEGGK
jgi:1-acyl-sn-glycerol-3-phosphate acyltransferase